MEKSNNIIFINSEDQEHLNFPYTGVEYQYSENKWNNPYYPFLDIIKANLETYNESDLLEILNSSIYKPHIEIFYNFIKNTNITRDEEIIFEELTFEIKLIETGIAELVKQISTTKPINVRLSNYNIVPDSTDKIIKHLNSTITNENININILCIYVTTQL